MLFKKKLLEICPDGLLFDFPLNKISYLCLGGRAKYLISIKSKGVFLKVMSLINGHGKNYLILGKGSNVLINDEEIDEVILTRSQAKPKVLREGIVEFPSSMPLNKAINFAHKNGLYGMEFLIGIPGSIGGAIVMNAGTPEGEVSGVLHSAEVLRGGEFQMVLKENLNLSYRSSNIGVNEFVFSGIFKLQLGDAKKINEMKAKCLKVLESRKNRQPVADFSLGSTFKNPYPFFAGQLIEECGLKGKKIGGISVSCKHANFMVNEGNGRAQDALALIRLIQDTVWKEKGIFLEKEIKLFGF